ncbi:hypothetical protein CI109_102210 [Kwoniella shandongensis]|uniref:Uncharacterized protein n=1 Tax=Kwoniella shandongensis TaxID=1734106 RepID=A0A5M6C020_9TREE|nr:uncharacterized protein CI109_003636 [Kwoniella shandongensis]KAA5527981.1 hypothetical protein CI109_003636 [Kwoniella shandongensis]
MVRATTILRNAANAGKPKPMSADHTLYHVTPTGFWKKFHKAMVVNPDISSGLPIPELNRYPQPASRPETYATPATKASDVAFNPYHKRDVRRAYPQTSVVTQSELSSLLLSSPTLASLPSPETATEIRSDSSAISPSSDSSSASQSIVTSSVPSLSSVLEKLPAGKAFVGAGIKTASGGDGLPPAPPSPVTGKWVPKQGAEVPHDKDAYFPMFVVN